MPIPDDTSVRMTLRAFVQENFLYMKPDYPLSDDDALLKSGIVDSMGVMEVLAFLDEQFGVDVPGEDVTEANLGCISAMVRYVSAVANKP